MVETRIRHIRNACTLIAVQEVTGASDERVLETFLAKGYRKGYGVRDSIYMSAAKDLGAQFEEVNVKNAAYAGNWWRKVKNEEGEEVERIRAERYVCLGTFIKDNPVGTYIAVAANHAFVVRDGRVIDVNLHGRQKLRRRVYRAWRILNPAPSTLAEELKATVTARLKRHSNPVVKFTHPFSNRGQKSKAYAMEQSARRYIYREYMITQKDSLRLDDIVAGSSYTRKMAADDLRDGILTLVSQ